MHPVAWVALAGRYDAESQGLACHLPTCRGLTFLLGSVSTCPAAVTVTGSGTSHPAPRHPWSPRLQLLPRPRPPSPSCSATRRSAHLSATASCSVSWARIPLTRDILQCLTRPTTPPPPRTRAVKLDSLSSDFHASVAAKCAAYRDELETKADSHRSYFSQIPELEEVLAAPELVGGLQSLLGAGYVQHPHRTMHTRQGPGPGGDQDWHKVRCLFASREACRDGHLVRSYLPRLATKSFTSVSAAAQDGHHIPIRHHFPRWIICFYYPTDVTEDMGPTAVIPSSHYYTTDRNDSTGPDGPGPWADDRLE